ncbi:MAG TPA: preprotein translocase subunit SecG [Nitrospirota bacterium]|jgi:preprotein translocase subunit SecG
MVLFLTILHIIVCITLVLVVLLQSGKGASIGASFGGGSSQTLFGSRGAGDFLTKLTSVAGALFMITSLALALYSSKGLQSSVVKPEAPSKSAPAPSDTAPARPAMPAMPSAPAPSQAPAAPAQGK